jgi:hypothetical protein
MLINGYINKVLKEKIILHFIIQMEKIGRVYKITNDLNDKKYIGSTFLSLSKRMSKHKKAMNEKRRSRDTKFYASMKEIGRNHFKIELIKEYKSIDRETLLQKETKWIIKYKTIENGYNTSRPKITEEQRKKYVLEWAKNNEEHIKAYRKTRYESLSPEQYKTMIERQARTAKKRRDDLLLGEKKYICETCKYETAIIKDFQSHLKRQQHTKMLFQNELPFYIEHKYSCDECDYVTSDLSKLNRHTKIHK